LFSIFKIRNKRAHPFFPPAPAPATPQGDKGDALLALLGDDLNLDWPA
jgi:hypothetical protein